MDNDAFKISEQAQRMLIIKLLIRVAAENSAMRNVWFTALAQNNPEKLASIRDHFRMDFLEKDRRIRNWIFEHFGQIDMDDIFGSDPM